MTDPQILLLLVKCVPALLAVFIFLHLLCDEYVRTLECLGVVRRRLPGASPAEPPPTGRESRGLSSAVRVRTAPRPGSSCDARSARGTHATYRDTP